MKNNFTPPYYKNPGKIGFLRILTAFVLASLLLSSCVQEPESPRVELSERDQLSKVRNWFEQNKAKLRLPERGNNLRSESQELILPFFEKEPDWDQFHHYYFPDGREVFEVSLANATKYFPASMLDSFPDRNPAELVIQNIMFVKHPTEERFDPLISRYYPDGEGSIEEFENISYNSIPPLLSGNLEVFTYNERFFVGFQFSEGVLDHSYRYQPYEGDKKFDHSNFDVKCVVTYHEVGYSVCSGGICNTTVERMVGVTSCSGDSYGDSYVYSGGSGDYTGPSAGTDGDGTCSSCDYGVPVLPGPNLRIEIHQSFKDKPNLICTLEKLKLSDFVSDLALFDGTPENMRNVILKVGETKKINGWEVNAYTDPTLIPYRIEITLNEKKLNRGALEIARTILHEIIHAEIMVANDTKKPFSFDPDFTANYNRYKENYEGYFQSHNYMADYLIGKMADVLREIHPYLGKSDFESNSDAMAIFPRGLAPPDYYKALAWIGLKDTEEWEQNSLKEIYTDW